MTLTNFINLRDFSGKQLEFLIDRAITDKALWKAGRLPRTLAGKTLAMILEKPSLRTRVSFETAMTDLDGHAIYLTKADIGLGSREDVKDIARVLGRMCDGIMARTFSHEFVEALGRWACVPVINALTDYSHPCQAMADLMTLKEISGGLSGRKVAFVGDGNNVARSLATACASSGCGLRWPAPRLRTGRGHRGGGARPGRNGRGVLADSRPLRRRRRRQRGLHRHVGVDGPGSRKIQPGQRLQGLPGERGIDGRRAARAVVMHCLPAYRGFEISDGTMEAFANVIFEEAENRLHFQRTLLSILMGEGGVK